MIDVPAAPRSAEPHRRAAAAALPSAPARLVAMGLAAGAVAAGALAASEARAQGTDPAPAGRSVIAELPPLPDGPVCVKDRDWIVVEAEQFIARTTARAEDLSKKVIEQELAADRDPAAGRAGVATRADQREALRRVRDAQGFREEARRLTTRDCLVREGQGVDLRNASASVAGAATAQAPQAAEPMIDVRLAQGAPCAKDSDCEITLVSETKRPATDDRRVAVLIDLPSSAGTFVRSGQAWNCYAMTGGAVCLAKLAELKPGAPVESKLTWRLQGAMSEADARFCTRTVRSSADGRPTTDPDRMRLLQAVLADYGYRSGAIDGRFADGTRVVLASAAPDFGIERSGDDDRIAAALLGSMVSRVGVTTGPCLQLALAKPEAPAAPTATDAPAPAPEAAAPAVAAVPVPVAAPAPAAQPSPAAAAPIAATAPTRPAGPPRPGDAAAAPAAKAKGKKAVATLGDDDPPAPPAKSRVAPVREKPVAVRAKPPRPAAAATEEPETVVIVKKPKRRVVVEEAEAPPRYVQPAPPQAQPRIVAPPVSIGIGFGRRGGFGIGF